MTTEKIPKTTSTSSNNKGANRALWALLLAGLLLRLIIAPFTSYPSDMAGLVTKSEWAYIFQFNPLYWEQTGVFRVAAILAPYPVHIIASLLGFGNILTLQLAIKLPYILADMGIAILLYKIAVAKTQDQRIGYLLAFAWLFNPFAIFVSSVHGLDTLPVFFVLLSVFYLIKNKHFYSFVCLSIAAVLKYFAFFLFPLFLLYSWRKMARNQKIFSLLGSFAVLGMNFLPLLSQPVFRSQLVNGFLFYSTGVERLTIKQWSLWGWLQASGILNHFTQFIQTYLFWIAFTPLYVWMMVSFYRSHSRSSVDDKQLNLWKYVTIVLLLFPPLNPYASPQHLVWGLPFLVCLSYLADKRLGILVSTLWALNLASFFTHPWSSPFIYLKNAYPTIVNTYQWPDTAYLSVRLGYLYSLSMIVAIWAVLRLKPSLGQINSTNHPTVQAAVFRNWGSILTCLVAVTFVFSTLRSLPPRPLPVDPADREYVYRQIFSFKPSDSNTSTSEEYSRDFKFKVNAIPFMTDTTWNAAHAYVEFENLPYGVTITVNGQDIPYSAVAQRTIPYSTKVVDFLEIPDPRKNLRESTTVEVRVPESQIEFKGITNGGFENGLAGWSTWNPTQTSTDETIKKQGSRSLVTRRTETSGWVFVYQDIAATERTSYKIELWMRIQNARQASPKTTYHDKTGQSIGNIQDFLQLPINGTTEWWKISSRITTPPGTVFIRLWNAGGASLDGANPGITWFDNVTISAITPSLRDLKATIMLNFDIDQVKPWWRD